MSVVEKWNLTLNSPLGPQPAVLEIEAIGGGFQGSLAGTSGPSPVEDLSVEGERVSFTADADTPVGRLRLTVSGSVIDDRMAGKYRMSFGEFDFSGTRA